MRAGPTTVLATIITIFTLATIAHATFFQYPSVDRLGPPGDIGHIESTRDLARICHCNPRSIGYGGNVYDLRACENSCHEHTTPDCPRWCTPYRQPVLR